MPLDVLTRTTHAVAAAARPADALAATLAAVRAVTSAGGGAILRAEGGRLVPVMAQGLAVVERPLDETSLRATDRGGCGSSYPLVHAGHVEGILLLEGLDGAVLTCESPALAPLLDLAAVTLHNGHLMDERRDAAEHMQRLNSRLRLLLDMATLLATTLEPDALLDALLKRLVEVLPNADMGTIYLYDAKSDRLLPRSCVGLDPEVFARVRLRPGESISGMVFQSGQAQKVDAPEDVSAVIDSLSTATPELAANDTRVGRLRSILTAPLRTTDGAILGTLSIGSTVTGFDDGELPLLDGVAAHAAMALHNARLFAQAQDDARELAAALADVKRAQEQVIQQERLRAVGEMASGIAHDFNNALSPVIGFSELLLAVPDNLKDEAKVRHYLELINTGALDAAAVVGRLRQFYRERDEDEVHDSVDVASVVKQVIELTQPRWRDQAQAQSRTINVELALEPVPAAAAQPSDLREALTNLIFNAVDALPKGGTITLGCRLDDQGSHNVHNGQEVTGAWAGARVALWVRDTGTGMPEEVRRRCLEPFFTTKGQEGTGLGLSMVYGTVRRWGGDLTIESAPGQGTAITILLPVYEPTTHAVAPHADTPDGPALHVLVVDDEPGVLEVTTACLRAGGHTSTPATGGRAALAALREGRFDVVITDRAMPGMSGDQLAVAIKMIAPDMPVVMLTGFGSLMRVTEEKPPGVDVIAAKPVTLATLREALSSARAA